MLRFSLLPVLVAGLALVAGVPSDDTVKEEMAKFEGTWQLTSRIIEGKPMANDKLADQTISVKGEQYIFHVGGITAELTFKVDPTKDPKTIDITYTKGTYKGRTLQGIYKIEGDTLTMCRAIEPDEKRPTDFTAKEGSGRTLLVCKRKK